MSRNKIGEDSPIPKFIYLKIRRRDGVESLTTLEEGEFKVPIDGCINMLFNITREHTREVHTSINDFFFYHNFTPELNNDVYSLF